MEGKSAFFIISQEMGNFNNSRIIPNFSLIAYPAFKDTVNYGTIQIISYQELQNYNYTILEDGGDYWVIEINGEIVYIDKPSS